MSRNCHPTSHWALWNTQLSQNPLGTKIAGKSYVPFDQNVLLPCFYPSKAGSDPFCCFPLSGRFSASAPHFDPAATWSPDPAGDNKGPCGWSRAERCPQETGALLHLPQASCTFPHLLILFPSTKRPESPKMYPKTLFQLSLSMNRGSSEAGPSDHFSLQSLASFSFFSPCSLPKELLPKCVFHMFPISHALCLTNLLPAPLADAINLLPVRSRARQQNSRHRS